MEIVKIVILSFSSVLVLFILTKLMGEKQMSQLSMFDYINGITIGSIAAEMATNLEEFHKPLIAMVVYAAVAILISFATNKSIKLRRLIVGKPLLLYENGKLYKKNINKSKLDLGEFLAQCRINGYFDLSDIKTAILEANGKISFLPVTDARPVNVKDLALTPEEDTIIANVIMDGNIMEKNLQHTGNNKEWLMKQLLTKGIKDASTVFLATCDASNTLSVYLEIEEEKERDMFE